MTTPCIAFEEMKSMRFDDYEKAILKELCEEPECGIESSRLQKLVQIDKVTFYRRLQRLSDDLRIVERLPYTSTGVRDRRRVYYTVRTECQDICNELVAGFEIRKFLDKTLFQSLDPREAGSGRIVPIGSRGKVSMAVFSNKKLDPSLLSRKFDDEKFRESLPNVVGEMFESLIEGLNDKNGIRVAIVLTYPMVRGE